MSEDLELPSDLASIDPALAFVRSRAPTWVTDEVIDFGVTEAVTNAIVHGRGEAQARSVFALRVAEEILDGFLYGLLTAGAFGWDRCARDPRFT